MNKMAKSDFTDLKSRLTNPYFRLYSIVRKGVSNVFGSVRFVTSDRSFAQMTFRESLRDIEACLRAQQGKLYHTVRYLYLFPICSPKTVQVV